MSLDLNAVALFVTVAEVRSFSAAAQRSGITRSAVSQTIRRLENSLGIALFARTTRSLSLTEAGEAFLASSAPAIAAMRAAAEAAGDRPSRPSGVLRLAVSSIAERFLSGPLLASFREACPDVRLDIFVTDAEFDIVAGGFDAGVRLGEVIAQDMIAIPVSPPQRQLVVGAPAYFDRCGTPAHPRELTAHRCIGWRPAPGMPPYRWEFAEGGHDFDVAVDPAITTNDMLLMIRIARAGAGLTFGMAETFEPWIAEGSLLSVLDDFSADFPGFYLFYPDRRNLAPKLRALIDHARWRGGP